MNLEVVRAFLFVLVVGVGALPFTLEAPLARSTNACARDIVCVSQATILLPIIIIVAVIVAATAAAAAAATATATATAAIVYTSARTVPSGGSGTSSGTSSNVSYAAGAV